MTALLDICPLHSGPPDSRAGRCDCGYVVEEVFRGRSPRRVLSQTLIIILLLISPLSFSAPSVPNFAPACVVLTPLIEKANAAIAAVRHLNGPLLPVAPASVVRYEIPSPSTHPTDCNKIPSTSRAPPSF